MNPDKALWEKGDFTRIAATMRDSGEAFVATLGIETGLKVLDLGCCDGTTALPAAKLGANVLGVDIARNLVEAGNRGAQEQGTSSVVDAYVRLGPTADVGSNREPDMDEAGFALLGHCQPLRWNTASIG